MRWTVATGISLALSIPQPVFAHAGHVHLGSLADPIGGWWVVAGVFLAGLVLQQMSSRLIGVAAVVVGSAIPFVIHSGTIEFWTGGLLLGAAAIWVDAKWISASSLVFLTTAFVRSLDLFAMEGFGDLFLFCLAITALGLLGALTGVLWAGKNSTGRERRARSRYPLR